MTHGNGDRCSFGAMENQLDPAGPWSDWYFDFQPDHGNVISRRRLQRNGGHHTMFYRITPFMLHRVKRDRKRNNK